MEESEAHCRELMQRLHPFVDNELDEDMCGQLRRHLAECSHCEGMVTVERAFRLVVKEKCTERDVPSGLEERLRALIWEHTEHDG
jgi:mycothiol system anti-sigma-R factor